MSQMLGAVSSMILALAVLLLVVGRKRTVFVAGILAVLTIVLRIVQLLGLK